MKFFCILSIITLLTISGYSQTHFESAHAGSGSEYQMNVYIFAAIIGGANLEKDDEIGLFSGSICVGAFKLTTGFSSIVSLIADKADAGMLNGYTSESPILIKIWDSSESKVFDATIEFDPESPCFVYTDNGTAIINKISVRSKLTIRLKAKDKIYDGSVSADVGYSVEDGSIEGDVLVTLTNGKFNNKNVGIAKPVIVDIDISGHDVDKYDFIINRSISADIIARPITICADAKSITYGEPDPELTAQVTSGSVMDGDTVSGVLNRVAGTFVKTYTIGKGTFSYGSNYSETFIPANLTINPKELRITANDTSFNYNGLSSSMFTISYEGFVYGETTSVLDGKLTFSGSAVDAISAGDGYVITPGGLTSANYTIIYIDGVLNINQAPLTIEANNKSKTYDGLTYNRFTVSYSGFVNNETELHLNGKLRFSGSSVDAINAGDGYVIAPGGLTSNNYEITYKEGILKINKAELIVSAIDKTSVAGKIPELTLSYTGFVPGGDDITDIDVSPIVSTDATNESAAGIYTINVSGGSDNNYNFIYVNGKLMLQGKVSPTIVWNIPASITYGTLLDENQLNATSKVDGKFIYTPEKGTLLHAGDSVELTVDFLPVDTANYATASKTVYFDVKRAALTIMAVNKTITYGDVLPEFNYTITGFKNNESEAYLTSLPLAGVALGEGINAGTYVIALSHGEAKNYELNYITGLLTVAKALLTITADDKTSFEGTIPELTFTYTGFITDDDLTSIDLWPDVTTDATDKSSAGKYAIKVSGGTDNNYSFIYIDGELVLEERSPATINWDNPPSIIYGTSIGIGQLNAEADIAGAFLYNPSAGEILNAGENLPLTVQFTPTDSIKYAITVKTVYIDVEKAVLTVTADNKTMKVAEEVPELTISYAGFVNGDDEEDIDIAPVAEITATSIRNKGNYEITVSGGSDNNYSFEYNNGKLTIDRSSKPDKAKFISLSVYPNPFTDHVIIKNDYVGEGYYRLTDLNGKKLKQKKIGNGTTQLILSSLNSGIYFLQVFNGYEAKSFCLMKQ
jgi:hypothetical protein